MYSINEEACKELFGRAAASKNTSEPALKSFVVKNRGSLVRTTRDDGSSDGQPTKLKGKFTHMKTSYLVVFGALSRMVKVRARHRGLWLGDFPVFHIKIMGKGKKKKTAKTPTGAPAVDMSRHQYLFSVKLGGWVGGVCEV